MFRRSHLFYGEGPQQLPSCHSSARVGGVISTQLSAKFCKTRAQWPGGKKKRADHILPAGTYVLSEGTRPRNLGVRGGGACEHHRR